MAAGQAMTTLQTVWHLSMSDGVPTRSLAVALVVGSILNVINQWEAVRGRAAWHWRKLTLTYCVPYLVATYGAVATRMAGLQ
jgi:hypothetical protein